MLMKSCKLLIICSILLPFLSACSPDQYEPTEGVWYCEELNIQLSYESDEITYMVIDGELVVCACGSDKGVDRILLCCQQEGHRDFYLGELLFEAQIIALRESELLVYVDTLDTQFSFERIK